MKKYIIDADLKQMYFGLVLMVCLMVVSIFAVAGLSMAEKSVPDAMDYGLAWGFMHVWTILGMICAPVYIAFFTKFNNPFKKINDEVKK